MSNIISGSALFPQVQQPVTNPLPSSDSEQPGFSDVLKQAISQVEGMHSDAQQQAASLLRGDNSDIHNVMIAVEKADIAFQLMMQVRNKIVNAYQDISKMQF